MSDTVCNFVFMLYFMFCFCLSLLIMIAFSEVCLAVKLCSFKLKSRFVCLALKYRPVTEYRNTA